MLFVQKYGGTSLETRERIEAAAKRMTDLAGQGHSVVAVVSARGHTTDELIAEATAINRRGSAREMDAYLASGEQISAALMAMAIGNLGYSAVSLTGWQAGIRTDAIHGNARIESVDTQRIRRELEKGRIVVVAGFQGLDPQGDITTLGRGGSDTTAVALAAWLGAEKCQIFTDVDGVYRCSMTAACCWHRRRGSPWRCCPLSPVPREPLWVIWNHFSRKVHRIFRGRNTKGNLWPIPG